MTQATVGLCASLAVVATLLSAGCREIHAPEETTRRESKSIDRGGAESVSVEIHLGAGELDIHGGAQSLMDATFRYSSSSGAPEVKYNVVGRHGRLIIRQDSSHISGHHGNDWDLRLNQDIPMDVSVQHGAGASRLDLGSVQVRNVDVEMGAGELKLDLTGQPKRDMEVRVRGGVGEATIRLPRSAAIEVDAHGGIGEIQASGLEKRGDRYVNDVPAADHKRILVNVRGGIGGIHLICE
jgi:hypothetical protein